MTQQDSVHPGVWCRYAGGAGCYLDNKAALVAGCLKEAGGWSQAPMDDPLSVQVGHPQAGLPGTAQQRH